MPSLIQMLFLAALPIIGMGVFFSSRFQASFSPLWSSAAPPQVKISQGLVVGTILDQNFPAPIDAFMGLPYAEAPVGERRFRRAVPLPKSNKTFKAQAYGPMYVLKVGFWRWLLIYLQMSRQAVAQRQKCSKQRGLHDCQHLQTKANGRWQESTRCGLHSRRRFQ